MLACLLGWSLPSRSAVCSGLLWRENVPFFLLGVRVMSLACPVVLQAWFLLRVLDAVLPETPAVGMGAIAHTLPKSLMSALQRQKRAQLNSTETPLKKGRNGGNCPVCFATAQCLLPLPSPTCVKSHRSPLSPPPSQQASIIGRWWGKVSCDQC